MNGDDWDPSEVIYFECNLPGYFARGCAFRRDSNPNCRRGGHWTRNKQHALLHKNQNKQKQKRHVSVNLNMRDIFLVPTIDLVTTLMNEVLLVQLIQKTTGCDNCPSYHQAH